MNKNNNQVYIKLSEVKALDTYEQNYNVSPKYSGIDIASVFAKLKNGGIKVSLKSGAFQKGFNDKVTKELIHDMTGFRIIEFKDNRKIKCAINNF